MARPKLGEPIVVPTDVVAPPTTQGGLYFADPKGVECFSSGCALLDCVLGAGHPLGRIINIVGDASTGKSLLAIEACANFAKKYPTGNIRYNEVEAAFDIPYAEALGLPVARVEFVQGCFTVEELFEDLKTFLMVDEKTDQPKRKAPGLYIVDSLDALSDKAEKEREFDEGSYNTGKAKQMGQLFRRLIQWLEKSKVTVIIISQERDNIGVTFGKKSTRSGGRALDFYASIILWLAQVGKMKRTIRGVDRPTGVNIRAKCEKNKVGLAYRECDFPILFGFGVDDVSAGLEWLIKVERLDGVSMTKEQAQKYLKSLDDVSPEDYATTRDIINEAVKEAWREIEIGFLPTRKKYT